MSSDEKVTVPVEMTRADVRGWAESSSMHWLVVACRAWLDANPEPEPEPERVVLRWHRWQLDRSIGLATAVPVDELRPGDRVAGRVVLSADTARPNGGEFVYVSWENNLGGTAYGIGTLILLDGES